MTATATSRPTEITIHYAETLPNGVGVIVAPLTSNDYEAFRSMPSVLGFDGKRYGKSGWNSDRQVAYFRTDVAIAEVL